MTRFRTQLNRSVTHLHHRKRLKFQHIFEYRPVSFYAVDYCTDALCIKDGVKIDPAAGSGNFLTETYLSIRRLENKVLKELSSGQQTLGFEGFNPIQVSIGQFYGIEINDFAVTVAKTALWIAEDQMLRETEEIVLMQLDFLPLKSYANIVEGNALRLDWGSVVPRFKLNYIMGNPPFVANSGRVSAKEAHSTGMQSIDQKEEKALLFGNKGGILDYVACWYKKAAEFMKSTKIRAALVSTNSICQGLQVAPLWEDLFKDGITINFAYQSFKWKTEAQKGATVYVVIIGFSYCKDINAKLFTGAGKMLLVNHINAYLVNASDVFIKKIKKPICNVPEIRKGSQPTDNGNLIIKDDEIDEFLKEEPAAKDYVKVFLGAEEFVNGKKRYCLWLQNISPNQLSKMPLVLKRIKLVKEFRLSSKKAATKKWADSPTLFTENRQPNTNFIAIPEISSGNRRYVPMGFMSADVVCSNKMQLIPDAQIYHFGILTSNVHMAWMRATCGYYGPSYDYSGSIVYNNFPWPQPTDVQKARIEQTAQAILDARALYPDSSFADLYDQLTMPPELRRAHQNNDKAVMQAYGFSIKDMTESSCVAELMKLYQQMTES